MTTKLGVVAFLVLFLVENIAAKNALHIPGFVKGKPLRHHLDKIRLPGNEARDVCGEELWFKQIVDHDNFGTSNNDTFDQRVQLNSKFFNPDVTDQPTIFLMIGGEGPAEMKWVCREDYTYMEMAKQYNALVIQLEHRFFGKSYPYKNATAADMSTNTLRLLTSQQALADLANFIQNFKYQNLKWTNPKWVVFGGSYPGSLCSWFRSDPRYSALTVGGICSSAPLWAKVDFYEYAEVMEFAFTNWSRIQNTNCDQLIRDGFYQLKRGTYSDAGRAILNAVFNITPPLDVTVPDYDLYATNFLANIFSVFQGIDQYTFDARDNITIGGYDINNLCKRMIAAGDSITGIKDIVFWDPTNPDAPAVGMIDNDYYGDMAYYNQSYYNYNDDFASDIAAGRGWMWLCCGMALGWLQTTDNGNGMFNRAIPLNYYFQQCSDMFGPEISPQYITDKVSQIGYIFPPPWNYTATNVVLPNGDYDPWSALGTYVKAPERHQISVLTHGAAHCADMYPARSCEPAGLEATRAIIRQEVANYLNQPQFSTTTGQQLSSTTTSLMGESTTSGGCSDIDTDCQNVKDSCKNSLYKPFMCKYCKQTCNFCFDTQCPSFSFMEFLHKY